MNEEIKNNITEENKNDAPRKKNLYVPDKELLAYSKAKKRKSKKVDSWKKQNQNFENWKFISRQNARKKFFNFILT